METKEKERDDCIYISDMLIAEAEGVLVKNAR